MDKGIFSDREKALEANYFRQQDAKLIERLRANGSLDEVAVALAEKLRIDDPDLLARARDLGITAETAPAFFLMPLVQVAWAEGSASKQEQQSVLRLSRERGIDEGSAAYAQLSEWLTVRPSDSLFNTALEIMNAGFAVLPPGDREERIQRVIEACRIVAEASGSEFAKLIGLGDGVSEFESSLLGTIETRLKSSS
jgi:hypothetical protein